MGKLSAGESLADPTVRDADLMEKMVAVKEAWNAYKAKDPNKLVACRRLNEALVDAFHTSFALCSIMAEKEKEKG